ncbi:MAG: sulfur oxidation c-type cytochrome SoxA, partial [Neptuniibacter sp.]|nr:sulfur oxidation c-type cytochrome SoxA [Neptuniibacter sp.]
MKIIKTLALGLTVAAASQMTYAADSGFDMKTVNPEADRIALQNYFKSRFPESEIADYVNGIYA